MRDADLLVVRVLFSKRVDIDALVRSKTYREYNKNVGAIFDRKRSISEREFRLIKRVYGDVCLGMRGEDERGCVL